MNKVLVTGAAGFIGSSVADFFLDKGYEVVGWDCCEAVRSFEIVAVDLLDKTKIMEQLEAVKPDIIIHCAGSADVGKSVQDPTMDYTANVTITHNLLFSVHALKMTDDVRFVFLSSAGVYGNPTSLPITEDMPLRPLSPYAVHKVMCEDLCRFFADNYGMNIKIARIFSAYGAGLKKQIFWDMYNKAKTTNRLDMFGTGWESRDYIHVTDVVQSIFLLVTVDSPYTVFNIANGRETTIRQATEIFAGFAKIPLENIAFNGYCRQGDPINWRADISRIRSLGYMESKNMESGLQEYVCWAQDLI